MIVAHICQPFKPENAPACHAEPRFTDSEEICNNWILDAEMAEASLHNHLIDSDD